MAAKLSLMRVLPVLFTSFFPLVASATWGSSGGEIFKDMKNPWFVKNTTTVRYCVVVDTSSISASVSDVEARVREALQFWKEELAKPLLNFPLGDKIIRKIEIGTQTFTQVDCAEPLVDLRFLVGYSTLSDEEKKELKDTTRFVGVTVRTDYDEVNLRGKGFIYISSDFGPYRYSVGNPSVIDRAWESPRMLLLTLIHEVGHVFGFTHKGTGVMSEIFLEQLVASNIGKAVEKSPLPSVVMPNLDLMDCGLTPLDLQFLNQNPLTAKCIYLKFSTTLPGLLSNGAEIEVFGSVEKPQPDKPAPEKFKVGTLKRVTLNQLDMKMDPAVFLHLNPKQTVFTAAEVGNFSYFVGSLFQEFGGEATFVPVTATTGTVKPAYFNVGPSFFKLFGQQANRVMPVFEANTPYEFTLIIKP